MCSQPYAKCKALRRDLIARAFLIWWNRWRTNSQKCSRCRKPHAYAIYGEKVPARPYAHILIEENLQGSAQFLYGTSRAGRTRAVHFVKYNDFSIKPGHIRFLNPNKSCIGHINQSSRHPKTSVLRFLPPYVSVSLKSKLFTLVTTFST